MTAVMEIRPQVWAISHHGRLLRQHYFTKESAQTAAQQLSS
jgi:hypothetical protein